MSYKYCTATYTGIGFITHEDAENCTPQSFPSNVYSVLNNSDGDDWIAKVSGTEKTQVEAQTLLDTHITNAQTTWDNKTESQRGSELRPVWVLLPF